MKLQINSPCKENWDSMQKNQNGRFCQSCMHEVIDFSAKTDEELIQFFKKNAGSKVCGRFESTQLNKPLYSISTQASKKVWKKVTWVVSCIVSTSTFLKAQEKPVSFITHQHTTYIQHEASINLQKNHSRLIKGYIVDKNTNNPLEDVHVFFGSKEYPTALAVSDSTGYFEILPFSSTNEDNVLHFSRIGYETFSLNITDFAENEDSFNYQKIAMLEAITQLEDVLTTCTLGTVKTITTGAVSCISIRRKHLFFGRIWDFIKKPFQRKEPK